MLNINNVTDLELRENEYCYLVGSQQYSNSSFNISVPHIMPRVTKGTENFNRNIFINASACKPTVRTSLQMQDYITVQRSGQCSLQPKANDDGLLSSGTGVQCTVTNGSYKQMKIVDYR